MDARFRRLERRWLETGDPELGAQVLRTRKRFAQFKAGHRVRLDAGKWTGADQQLIGNFVITVALNTTEGRTYTLARLDGDGEPMTGPNCYVSGVMGDDLARIIVDDNAPLNWEGGAPWLACELCGAPPHEFCVTPTLLTRNLPHMARSIIPPLPPLPPPLPITVVEQQVPDLGITLCEKRANDLVFTSSSVASGGALSITVRATGYRPPPMPPRPVDPLAQELERLLDGGDFPTP